MKGGRISYSYYMGRAKGSAQLPVLTDAQVDTTPKIAGQLVFSPDGKAPGNNHGRNGGNILFCDGHVENSPARASVALPINPGETLLNPW